MKRYIIHFLNINNKLSIVQIINILYENSGPDLEQRYNIKGLFDKLNN